MYASTCIAILLTTWTPAPARPMPTTPPTIAIAPHASATLAAMVVEVIDADSLALRTIGPDVAVTPLDALAMKASTSFEMSFSARATPIETLTARDGGPTATARENAPVNTVIEEVSSALSSTLAAEIPPVPLPSMYARTWSYTLFSVAAPAPVSAIPPAPLAIAADAATSVALIVWFESASSVSAPVAETLDWKM